MRSESELRPTHDSVVTAVRWRRVRRKANANLEGWHKKLNDLQYVEVANMKCSAVLGVWTARRRRSQKKFLLQRSSAAPYVG